SRQITLVRQISLTSIELPSPIVGHHGLRPGAYAGQRDQSRRMSDSLPTGDVTVINGEPITSINDGRAHHRRSGAGAPPRGASPGPPAGRRVVGVVACGEVNRLTVTVHIGEWLVVSVGEFRQLGQVVQGCAVLLGGSDPARGRHRPYLLGDVGPALLLHRLG